MASGRIEKNSEERGRGMEEVWKGREVEPQEEEKKEGKRKGGRKDKRRMERRRNEEKEEGR